MLERNDSVSWLSLRNAHEVHIVAVDQLNTYDVLASDDVVFTQGAFDALVNGTASSATEVVTEVEAPATQARTAKAPLATEAPATVVETAEEGDK